jgi:LL-diaminopimelate aminotransferase
MRVFQQADRLKGLTSAIFTQVDTMRKQAIAQGKDVITLSLGSPDLAPAPHIVAAIKQALDQDSSYGYTLSKGTAEFLTAVTGWYARKFNVQLDPATEVHSLMGSQDGLAHIGLCLINPGDVVLVPDPGYPIFFAGPLVAGAEIVTMPLKPENAYLPDLDAISPEVLQRTKIMILNYPNNPLAATAPRDFFVKVVELAKKYSFLVIHDFAYSELVFDGYRPDSFLSIPGAKDVAIEFHSLSKTYSMAGCRVAFVVGNAEVIALLGRLKSNFDYGIFHAIQQGAIAAMNGPDDCIAETALRYQRRRDILVDGFARFGWQVERPKGSMYLWAPVPTKQNSFDFVADLLKNTGVAVVPGIGFGECGEGYIRIALVQSEARLAEVADRAEKWLAK